MANKQIELACPTCQSNRLSFPFSDEDSVTCDDWALPCSPYALLSLSCKVATEKHPRREPFRGGGDRCGS
jgi:hypothetical protein